MAARASVTVDPARVHVLNELPITRGRYVLYWMQQSQRAVSNPALEYAVRAANAEGLPVLVGFGLMDGYPEAALRHYRFMVEGLRDTRDRLRRRGIPMVVRHGDPDDVALELAGDAALVVCDRGHLRHQRRWRERVARDAGRSVVQVEADVVVPVDVASDKAEWAARTIRPKLHAHLDRFLVEQRPVRLRNPSLRPAPRLHGLDLNDLEAVLDGLRIDRSVPAVSHLFAGGTTEAEKRLHAFVRDRLPGYTRHRSKPEAAHVSHLSMYLHFGHISPVTVALRVRGARPAPAEDRDAFLEELIVRRELAHNFVAFNPDYDRFAGLPRWARQTLERHASDPRPHAYSRRQLEDARTHDPYWNAAMREMRETGYLHNTMRMYWGKKILEWTRSPRQAYRVTLALNNRYLLDGRDPASYANVGWVFGLHDRPWKERPVFGTVRYMSAEGLERKSDIAAYVARVEGPRAEAAD